MPYPPLPPHASPLGSVKKLLRGKLKFAKGEFLWAIFGPITVGSQTPFPPEPPLSHPPPPPVAPRLLQVVVNYDFPATIEVYVHRIGRTGRVGAAGEAHSLFTPRSHSLARGLLTILEGAGQPVPAELTQLTQDGRRKWSDGVGKADRREGQERRRYRPY